MKKYILMSFLFSLLQAQYPISIRNPMPKKVNPYEHEHCAYVLKKVLPNGMTILVRPVHAIPKVSMQIWYNVGSKDEKTGEKGIAHLIEHMIFKGTDVLSESDINEVVHKLSGSCNAFTSYDYTGYKFDMPKQNWKEMLPVVAECMTNCGFKDDHLNSEMKAVIQELKMRKDNYTASLAQEMLTTIFPDHPYHYPVIGYKQDLWSVGSENLKDFYKKHYLPNNATLVIVGDVNPDEVFTLAEKYFGEIPARPDYKKERLYYNKDIVSKGVTLYRDIKQPLVLQAYVVPGTSRKKDHILDLITYILGSGKAARLNRKLVDELRLVTSMAAFNWKLFDHSLFFIAFEPKNMKDISKISNIINHELDDITQKGLSDRELIRAIKKSQMKYYHLLENMDQQAYEIGKNYLATNDENYVFHYLDQPKEVLHEEIKQLLGEYFRPTVMHKGMVLPLPAREKSQWDALQQISDELDNKILSARIRESEVEPISYAKTIEPKKPVGFDYPKAQTFNLPNGLKVLMYENKNTPKINLVVEFKAKHYYDPDNLPGLSMFVSRMLSEGTKNYSALELADELEARGMSLSVYPGGITMTMLKDDLEKGIELLQEVLTNATFDKNEIEKVRIQLLVALKNFWDEPRYFSSQLIKEKIYEGHPYSKNSLGTPQSIKKITRKDLVDYYKKYITPQGSKLAIVGDFDEFNIKSMLQRGLSNWRGGAVQSITFPPLKKTNWQEINYPINRDQIVLGFAGLSINRKHPDFDKLQIFDQILGGGALGSLSSRLFQLREQTGLFYTINGSLVAQADEQPGMILVKTIVSADRLKEAEEIIKNTLEHVADTITPEEFDQAKNAILNALILNFESNNSIANAMLFLDRYNFPADYFDKRADHLEALSITDIQDAVKQYLHPSELLTLRVGRVTSGASSEATAKFK